MTAPALDLASARSRLAFAVDLPTLDEARSFVGGLRGHVGVLKVGLELFCAHGPEAAGLANEAEAPLFLDLKLHDIPKTVERAARAARRTQAAYLTVHASGGRDMLAAALEGAGDMKVLAITALTSLDDAAVARAGFGETAAAMASRLAELAFDAGVRGFVCSPREVADLRARLGSTATLVSPGIRPASTRADTASDDQQRIATPSSAIAAGADLLVVGRPIRDAPHPAQAADDIVREIAQAGSTEYTRAPS